MNLDPKVKQHFSQQIIDWYGDFGRKNLPWQHNRTPYRVWVSEIMLQQTQVATVIDYYHRFMQKFPTVQELAAADIDEVLHLWTGLGYYARARNLHKAAKTVVEQYDGEFPTSLAQMESLPGIGRSTAAAILSLALDLPHPILDGNVKRIIARVFEVEGWYGQAKVIDQMWKIVEQLSPKENIQPYNQALMDIGATLCTRSKPDCEICPVAQFCQANINDRVSEFPHKKPKKEKPVKTEYWPIVMFDNKLMLNQRPPSGIWGGLYCFNGFEDEQSLNGHISKKGYVIKTREPLPEMKHIFTHFQLNIRPVVLLLEKEIAASEVAEGDSHLWFELDSELSVGVPTPVVKLIKAIKRLKLLD